MKEAFANLNHFKSVIAYQHFVYPADRDYVISRWLLLQNFSEEFFWHAAQAVEKYLKASLLLNGRSVKKQGHDLVQLYSDHKSAVGTLAITAFERPPGLHVDYWHDETIEVYLRKLSQFGSADSRYRLLSWNRSIDDLFKLKHNAKFLKHRSSPNALKSLISGSVG